MQLVLLRVIMRAGGDFPKHRPRLSRGSGTQERAPDVKLIAGEAVNEKEA